MQVCGSGSPDFEKQLSDRRFKARQLGTSGQDLQHIKGLGRFARPMYLDCLEVRIDDPYDSNATIQISEDFFSFGYFLTASFGSLSAKV